MKRFRADALVIAIFVLTSCAHRGQVQPAVAATSGRAVLGYLQLKTPYADAAWQEGKLQAVKRVLEHKHLRTKQPYPCWNELRPFHGRNLPVSLKVESTADVGVKEIIRDASLPIEKFDTEGKDGVLTSVTPKRRDGYSTWRIERVAQRLRAHSFPSVVTGLVDVSGSMQARKKLMTLRGLRSSGIQFQKLYSFSSRNTLREVELSNFETITPKGKTALYDSVEAFVEQHPNEEVVIVTDGKDNESKLQFQELLERVAGKAKMHVVLTGSRVWEGFAEIARRTGGRVLRDLAEKGEITQIGLEVVVE